MDVAVPQLVVESSRAAMAVAADAFFGAPTERLTVAGRHRHERQDDDRPSAPLDPRGGREADGDGRDRRVGRRRRPAARAAHDARRRSTCSGCSGRWSTPGDEAVVLEASSHGSHYRRLDRVRFDALAFTNLSQDHLDLHGDMEEYFQAKRRLFTGVAPPPAAVNVGDPYGRRLADELAGAHRAPLVTFGLRPEAEVRADGLELGAARLDVHGRRHRDRDTAARRVQRRERPRRGRGRRCCSTSTRTRSRPGCGR